jgi:hypothetical protein
VEILKILRSRAPSVFSDLEVARDGKRIRTADSSE